MNRLCGILLVLLFFGSFNACRQPEQEDMILGIPEAVAHAYAPDKRIAIFDIEIERLLGTKYVVRGKTSLPEAHAFLRERLSDLEVDFIDSVQVLPAAVLEDKTWALVSISVAPMRSKPAYSSEMVSQTTLGTPVKLLEKQGGWYRVQTPDLYLGWVSSGSLVPKTVGEMDEWKQTVRYVYFQNDGQLLSQAAEHAEPVSDLVLGNIIQVTGKKGDYLQAALPDGRTGFVRASQCIPMENWGKGKAAVSKILDEGRSLMGSPYLWGGTSTKGLDCSGFVKTCYLSQGIILARDASQQARFGTMVDVEEMKFEPGDLLFFGRSKEKITHVGLYLGDDKFIHCSGRVKISSFNPEDEAYEAHRRETLVASRRLLNSVSTGQIIPVTEHPWYN